MYKKPKKEFPIKYIRKGLFTDEELVEEELKKKEKRHIKKNKFSVHEKNESFRKKNQIKNYYCQLFFK